MSRALSTMPRENARIGDLIVLAKPHTSFGRVKGKGFVRRSSSGGHHGYLPTHPAMWTAFVCAGPSIKRLVEPVRFRLVDLAPTVLELLGLAFTTPIDGRTDRHIVRPASRRIAGPLAVNAR